MRGRIMLTLCFVATLGNAVERGPHAPFIDAALARTHENGEHEHVLRELIAAHPGQASVHFRLGVLLAGERRWPEARQAFARAEALLPGQADILYNLAVCLDHLEQTAAASQHYRDALDLAGGQPHRFPVDAARQRLAQLQATRP